MKELIKENERLKARLTGDFNSYYSSWTNKRRMPKEMSDWLEDGKYDARVVTDDDTFGYVMKSSDCTIVFYPNWNCDEQFARIVNKNRVELEDD